MTERAINIDTPLGAPTTTTPHQASTTTRVRALTGPHRGVTFSVAPGQKLLIGRDEGCDVQILDSGVSRQHASITCDSDGRYILEDLGSGNGTFMDRQSIHRVMLKPGEIFEVMQHRYRFIVEESVASLTQGHRPHEHELVQEIADYRSLRTRVERGEAREPHHAQELAALKERLSTPEDPNGYRSFECCVTAQLRSFGGPEQLVQVTEIGVDGATLDAPSLGVEHRALIWLVIETKASVCMFLARRVPSADNTIRLTFAGSNDWSTKKALRAAREDTLPGDSYRASFNAASGFAAVIRGQIDC